MKVTMTREEAKELLMTRDKQLASMSETPLFGGMLTDINDTYLDVAETYEWWNRAYSCWENAQESTDDVQLQTYDLLFEGNLEAAERLFQ